MIELTQSNSRTSRANFKNGGRSLQKAKSQVQREARALVKQLRDKSRVRKAALVEEAKKRVLIGAFKEDHTQEDGDSNQANTIASAPSSMASPNRKESMGMLGPNLTALLGMSQTTIKRKKAIEKLSDGVVQSSKEIVPYPEALKDGTIKSNSQIRKGATIEEHYKQIRRRILKSEESQKKKEMAIKCTEASIGSNESFKKSTMAKPNANLKAIRHVLFNATPKGQSSKATFPLKVNRDQAPIKTVSNLKQSNGTIESLGKRGSYNRHAFVAKEPTLDGTPGIGKPASEELSQLITAMIKKKLMTEPIPYIRIKFIHGLTHKEMTFGLKITVDQSIAKVRKYLADREKFLNTTLFYKETELTPDTKLLSDFKLPPSVSLLVLPKLVAGDYTRQDYTRQINELEKLKDMTGMLNVGMDALGGEFGKDDGLPQYKLKSFTKTQRKENNEKLKEKMTKLMEKRGQHKLKRTSPSFQVIPNVVKKESNKSGKHDTTLTKGATTKTAPAKSITSNNDSSKSITSNTSSVKKVTSRSASTKSISLQSTYTSNNASLKMMTEKKPCYQRSLGFSKQRSTAIFKTVGNSKQKALSLTKPEGNNISKHQTSSNITSNKKLSKVKKIKFKKEPKKKDDFSTNNTSSKQ
uniref:CDT1 domain-containing protein n=1 Tax=Rhabditophanes sp. KR3021 TaxID=114890 RepID=A0AC35TGU3_9BILA